MINYIIFLFIIYLFNKNDLYFTYSLILGLALIFKSSEIIFSFFEAKSLLKYIVISQLIGLLSSFLIIIYAILNNLGNNYLYFALVFDFIIVFLFINIFYFVKERKFFIKIDFVKTKKLLIKSLPILITSLSIYLYMRIDQIMINQIMDEYNLGIYSVSVRFIEIFHFIPKIIMISYLPIILKSKKYNLDLTNLNSFLFKVSLIVVLFILITSKILIPYIFGQYYVESIFTTLVFIETV